MNSHHPLKNSLDHILCHTERYWEEFRGGNIFLTGGTGFIGCWLLESFAWANTRLNLKASALVLSRDTDLFRKKAPHLAAHPAINFHAGDIRSFEFPKGSFSHIIHAATPASAHLNKENPLMMFETIFQGTRHVLDFAAQCQASKLLLTSSGAVYGPQPPEMTHIPEEYSGAVDSAKPTSAYGEGKRAAELLCTIYAQKYGIETMLARCFTFVGPYLPLDIHYAIGNFIRDGLQGGPIQVLGDGTPYRSYLFAGDLAIWLWTILFRGKSCRPYNVGSEESITIAEVAKIVAQCFQDPIKVSISNTPETRNPLERYVPSTKRAREELGLRQIISLKEGIASTIQHYSDNP